MGQVAVKWLTDQYLHWIKTNIPETSYLQTNNNYFLC